MSCPVSIKGVLLIDGKLQTDEEMKAFLEPYSPPAPPPVVTIRRSRKKAVEPKIKSEKPTDDEIDEEDLPKIEDLDLDADDLDEAEGEEEADEEVVVKPVAKAKAAPAPAPAAGRRRRSSGRPGDRSRPSTGFRGRT